MSCRKYDYSVALTVIRDARKKRGKVSLTKKFFDTLKVVNREIPASSFYDILHQVQPHSAFGYDYISNELLRQHISREIGRGRVAKSVKSDGNCLFNSVSVALIGKCSTPYHYIIINNNYR